MRDKSQVLTSIISEYQSSPMYNNAVEAQAYFRGDNTAILNRLNYMQKNGVSNSKMVFHRVANGIFPKLIKQLTSYELGNGTTLDPATKEKLGVRFDNTFQQMARQALVDGVNWGYWQSERRVTSNATGETLSYKPGKLMIFRATEFMPLLDEYTGDMRAGIRFTQIAPNKPMRVELFEEDGLTVFICYDDDTNNETVEVISDKTPYTTKLIQNGNELRVADMGNQPTIPVFPLYANSLHRSELTVPIKSKLDAYDFINSDLADSLTTEEGLYWLLKNYGGDEASELINEIRELKATMDNISLASADSKIVEVPYQGKMTTLENYRKEIYADFMGLDLDTRTTSHSMTATEVKASQQNLDLKADDLGEQLETFVLELLEYLGLPEEVPTFKRRTMSNDTETVETISKMMEDGYVDRQWAIENNPLIADEDKAEVLKRLAIKDQEEADEAFPIEEIEEETETEEAANNEH